MLIQSIKCSHKLFPYCFASTVKKHSYFTKILWELTEFANNFRVD